MEELRTKKAEGQVLRKINIQFTFLSKSLNVGVCANIFSSEADEKGINKDGWCRAV